MDVKGVFLGVLFASNGEPVMMEGWEPLPMPSLEICLERRDLMQKYMESIKSKGTAKDFYVFCLTDDNVIIHIDLAKEKFKDSGI